MWQEDDKVAFSRPYVGTLYLKTPTGVECLERGGRVDLGDDLHVGIEIGLDGQAGFRF